MRVFFGLLLIFFLPACSISRVKLIDVDSLDPLSVSEEQTIIASLSAQAAQVQSARLLYKTTLSKTLGKEVVKQAVVFKRPDHLRIEFFATELNKLVSLITADGEFIEALDPEARVLYRGEASPANLEQLFSVPFSPEELMYWLLGMVNVQGSSVQRRSAQEADSLGTDFKLRKSPDFYLLQTNSSDGRILQTTFSADLLGLSAGTSQINLLSVKLADTSGQIWFSSNYSQPDPKICQTAAAPSLIVPSLIAPSPIVSSQITPSLTIPRTINFTLHEENLDGKMELQTCTLNPSLDHPRLFHIQLPSDVIVKPLHPQPRE